MKTLKEHLEDAEHGEKVKLAKKIGISKANLNSRIKTGWRVGKLNGKRTMYNPNQANEF